MALISIYNLVLGLVNYSLGLGLDTYGLIWPWGTGLESMTAKTKQYVEGEGGFGVGDGYGGVGWDSNKPLEKTRRVRIP